MRPIVTIILLVVIVALVGYHMIPEAEEHPDEDRFIGAYVELMLLSASADTNSAAYIVKRDSILAEFGLTDTSLLALKNELNQNPERLIDIWDRVELRLKARRDSLGLPSGADTTKE
jgi:hypothetical protein